MNQSFALDYCLSHLRKSTIVVLKELAKANYIATKECRLIDLLSIIGKIIGGIVAKRPSYLTEKL